MNVHSQYTPEAGYFSDPMFLTRSIHVRKMEAEKYQTIQVETGVAAAIWLNSPGTIKPPIKPN